MLNVKCFSSHVSKTPGKVSLLCLQEQQLLHQSQCQISYREAGAEEVLQALPQKD